MKLENDRDVLELLNAFLPAAAFGAAVELGTNRRAGRPYLGPAVKEVEGELAKHLAKVATD